MANQSRRSIGELRQDAHNLSIRAARLQGEFGALARDIDVLKKRLRTPRLSKEDLTTIRMAELEHLVKSRKAGVTREEFATKAKEIGYGKEALRSLFSSRFQHKNGRVLPRTTRAKRTKGRKAKRRR